MLRLYHSGKLAAPVRSHHEVRIMFGFVGVMKYSIYVRLQTDFGKLREVGLKAPDLVTDGAPYHYPVCPRFKEFIRAISGPRIAPRLVIVQRKIFT